ncbi:MAG: cation transporter [Treponema sp.]|nr:cation transporter [Treponema sp.]
MEEDTSQSVPREKAIARTSAISIFANIMLAAFKALIGMASSSISIILDAVNNLSDALSSIITIIGIKLAAKKPDKKHPYGHGRIEYISASAISVIVLYAGLAALKESIVKIIRPQKPNYTSATIIILAAAILVKIFLGFYVKRVGKKVSSKALEASGDDAKNDALLSASVLASVLALKFFSVSLEAYVGVLISIFIIKNGIEILKNTLDDILGARVPRKTAIAVKQTICETPGVHGAYDLFLNDYGPERLQGSVHIEVDDTMTAQEIDELSNQIILNVYKQHRVILTAVGIYSRNTSEPEAVTAKEKIISILEGYKNVLQMHGFYFDKKKKIIKFDVIISFDSKDREAECDSILQAVLQEFPGYSIKINLDSDMSD